MQFQLVQQFQISLKFIMQKRILRIVHLKLQRSLDQRLMLSLQRRISQQHLRQALERRTNSIRLPLLRRLPLENTQHLFDLLSSAGHPQQLPMQISILVRRQREQLFANLRQIPVIGTGGQPL
uniref:(northern house mosquito) hypothetical protein n=1 Tax=Culex pipiens TaxID=7175 RepID=A0A8D8NPS8_CULPI